MNNLKNSVQLIGNLGKDVDLREVSSGSKVARFTLATNDYYKNNKGEVIKETQWHSIVAWGKTAELMAKVLKKGNNVVLHGKLVHRTYEDKEGNIKYTSEVKVNEFINMTRPEKEAVPF
ncbi:MAG: single-stranded DNA-binding protein [Saprospiraceae bacterium]|nr:single-stranded DNA-binding protein [Saprospiraceae bacterium]